MFRPLSIALLALIFTCPVFAHEYRVGELLIDHPWARELPPVVKNGAAYLRIENSGSTPDRILSASSSIAERAQLHTHDMENGLMKMRHVMSVDVPASGEVTFEPGGLHIMLFNIENPFVGGEEFPLTLTFEQAGEIEVTVKIRSNDEAAEPKKEMDHSEHGEKAMDHSGHTTN